MSNIHVLFVLLAVFIAPGTCRAATSIPEDKNAAVILSYSRVGEDAYPDSSITPGQFQDHVREILAGHYTVLPLPDIIKKIKSGQETADGTIAITFEGGYKSAFENAMPLLIQNKIPFTVFYAADKASQNSNQFLNWQDLTFLAKHSNVTFGVLPASYDHLTDKSEEIIRADINRAIVKHKEYFNEKPTLFSYPFGEYNALTKDIAGQSGFDAAFTLSSGVISSASDFMALPRFTMTESYGDIERFRIVGNALPLPVTDITPETSAGEIDVNDTPGFTVTPELANDLKAENLSCYISGQNSPEISILGTRVELRPQTDYDDRTRINCTLPGPDDRWRWFGMLLVNAPSSEADTNPPPDVPQ